MTDWINLKVTNLKLIKTLNIDGYEVTILEADDSEGVLKKNEVMTFESISGPEINCGFSLVFYMGLPARMTEYDPKLLYKLAKAEVDEKLKHKVIH